jgi:hypothetical protein
MQVKGKWVYDAICDPTRIVSKAMDYEFPNIIRPSETPDIAKICNHFSRDKGV